MAKPTKEDYEAAIKSKQLYADWIHIARENIDKLLDQIIESKENIALYKEGYDKANEIIERYKAYEEIEKRK